MPPKLKSKTTVESLDSGSDVAEAAHDEPDEFSDTTVGELWDPFPGLISFGGSELSPGCPVITQSLKIKFLRKRFQFRASP